MIRQTPRIALCITGPNFPFLDYLYATRDCAANLKPTPSIIRDGNVQGDFETVGCCRCSSHYSCEKTGGKALRTGKPRMLGLRPKLKARPSLVDLLVKSPRSPREGRHTTQAASSSDLTGGPQPESSTSLPAPAELEEQQQIASQLPLPPETPASPPASSAFPPHRQSSPSTSTSTSTSPPPPPAPPTRVPPINFHPSSSPATEPPTHSSTPRNMPPVRFQK